MSLCNSLILMGRIAVATSSSPIAVFTNSPGRFDAVFAATVTAKKRIAEQPKELIGIYTRDDDPLTVQLALAAYE